MVKIAIYASPTEEDCTVITDNPLVIDMISKNVTKGVIVDAPKIKVDMCNPDKCSMNLGFQISDNREMPEGMKPCPKCGVFISKALKECRIHATPDEAEAVHGD